ncbi:hypothetical protein [Streptomyces sp. NPDC050534]|uniref:DUF6197 family protein n=1 Tax=Streptomyces sp. NPDC050534 TaxID=3365625 RepID=UPI0037BA2BA8
MVTLSVTRSRIRGVLLDAAGLVDVGGWDALRNPVMTAIDQASGFVPGISGPDAERTTLDAYDALATHLDVASIAEWERKAGRTQLQIVSALHAAADRVMAT